MAPCCFRWPQRRGSARRATAERARDDSGATAAVTPIHTNHRQSTPHHAVCAAAAQVLLATSQAAGQPLHASTSGARTAGGSRHSHPPSYHSLRAGESGIACKQALVFRIGTSSDSRRREASKEAGQLLGRRGAAPRTCRALPAMYDSQSLLGDWQGLTRTLTREQRRRLKARARRSLRSCSLNAEGDLAVCARFPRHPALHGAMRRSNIASARCRQREGQRAAFPTLLAILPHKSTY